MRKQNGFSHVLLFLCIVLVMTIIGFAGWQVYMKQQKGGASSYGGNSTARTNQIGSTGTNNDSILSSLSSCSTSPLDHLPTDPTAISGVEALGHMNSGHILPSQADHVYFNMLPASSSRSLVTKVYSPGTVTVVEVTKVVHHEGTGDGTDYSLLFAPCRDVAFFYGHIVDVTDQKILDALSKAKGICSAGAIADNCTYDNISIQLGSGEQIGTAGGPTFSGDAFDFGASDDRTKPLAYIDTGSNALTGSIQLPGNGSYQHAVCPLDYFTGPLKQQLYARLTIRNAGANGIPACGATMQDRAGTIQGNWYNQKAKSNANGQGLDIPGLLAFAHSNLDPSLAVVSVGTDLVPSQWGGTQLMISPSRNGYINRDPSMIVPDGHVYCYAGQEGATLDAQGGEIHFDFQMIDANSLKIDYGGGACSANPTLSSPTTYVR